MTPLALAVDVLAVHRLTRLATKDTITQKIRDRVIIGAYLRAGFPVDAFADDVPGSGTVQVMAESDMEQGRTATNDMLVPRLAALVVCRWCASIWIAAGVVAARWVLPVEWTPVAYGLAASTAATLLAGLEP